MEPVRSAAERGSELPRYRARCPHGHGVLDHNMSGEMRFWGPSRKAQGSKARGPIVDVILARERGVRTVMLPLKRRKDAQMKKLRATVVMITAVVLAASAVTTPAAASNDRPARAAAAQQSITPTASARQAAQGVEGTYGPFNVQSVLGTCLTTDWNLFVYVANCDPGQKWWFVEDPYSYTYNIVSTVTGKCLEHFSYAYVWTATCSSSPDPNQEWLWFNGGYSSGAATPSAYLIDVSLDEYMCVNATSPYTYYCTDPPLWTVENGGPPPPNTD